MMPWGAWRRRHEVGTGINREGGVEAEEGGRRIPIGKLKFRRTRPMAILYTATCLLSLLTPQDPVVQPPAPEPFEMARVLPKESLMAMTINPLGQYKDAIRETGLFKILERVVRESDIGQQVEMGMTQMAMMTDLTTEQLETALSSGMGFSWTGLDAGGAASWIVAVNLGGSAEVLAKPFEQILNMAKIEGTVKAERWGDTLVHLIRLNAGLDLAAAIHGELLVVASSQKELEAALARRDGHGTPSLMEHLEFKGIVAELEAEGNAMCGFFMQPAELANLAVKHLPPEASGPVRDTIRALQVHKLSAFGYGAFVRNGEFHDYARLVFPEPRMGLLATLLTGSGDIDRDLFRLIPPDVIGYSLMSMSVSQILDRTLAVVSAVSPEGERMVGQMLVNLKNQSGVDVEDDLLATVGNQILSLQWPGGEMFGQDMAMVINLHDAWRFENAWEALQRMVPAPIRVSTIDNKRIYRYAIPDIPENRWPVMAVAGEYLVVASGDRAFMEVLVQIDRPQANNTARTYLSGLPKGTFLAAWVDLAGSLGTQLEMLKGLLPMGGDNQMFQTLMYAVKDLDGTMHSSVTRDERGVVFRSRSPIGNTQGIAMMMIGASVAIPNVVSKGMGRTQPMIAEVQWDAEMSGLMQVIAGAQQDYLAREISDWDGNGIAEYGNLEDLVKNGLLTTQDLGEDLGGGVYRRNGHLITLFLPEDTPGQETYYVAVAWPDERRTGHVYGSTQNRPVMANDIIAGVSGITRMDPRDVFIGGNFSAGLVTGWRDLGDVTTGATAPITPVAPAGSGAEVQAALNAEKRGDVKALVDLLKSKDTDVASRTAYALGNLKASDAVPELCEILTSRSDLRVRLQVMEALNKLKDPRSQKASTHALDSSNVMLRALAASNLGKLRDPDSVQPLLNMLGAVKKDATDHRDQVQALLALHDIGQADCLLPAAAVTTSDDDEVNRALAYLFQDLSPKLEPTEEVSALMAVLDHHNPLLRRFSIQRLGMLKDKTSARALEGRLAVEDKSLQPLIKIALTSIRGDGAEEAIDLVDRAKVYFEKGREKAAEYWGVARTEWEKLSDQERLIGTAGGGVFMLLVMMLMLRRIRRKRRKRGDAAAAMVAPSAEIGGIFDDWSTEGEQGEWAEEEAAVGDKDDTY